MRIGFARVFDQFKKTRPPIPQDLADSILVRSRHQCCMCKAYSVYIHHADEDPSNNQKDNLIPLCGNCHDRASKKGGLSRNITPAQLLMYKKDWYEKVELADKAAALGLKDIPENDSLPQTLGETKLEKSH